MEGKVVGAVIERKCLGGYDGLLLTICLEKNVTTLSILLIMVDPK